MRPLATRCPAKVNLSLHVLGRRADGYHALESLVAFAGCADDLRLEPGPDLTLAVRGPGAAAAGEGDGNLVLKAARALAERVPDLKLGAFTLIKRLPVAAGVGGGSSDAAGALRLLARLNGLPLRHPAVLEAARATGADVPVCLDPRARMMRGAGEKLGSPLRLPRLPAVLVNPGVPVPTGRVFAELGLSPGGELAAATHSTIAAGSQEEHLLQALAACRNDLEAPAARVAPEIEEALSEVRALPGCRLARMSGSGATVFGLMRSGKDAVEAVRMIRRRRRAWWARATGFR